MVSASIQQKKMAVSCFYPSLRETFCFLSVIFVLITITTVNTDGFSIDMDYSSLQTNDHWHDLDEGEDGEWGMVTRKENQFVVRGKPFYVNGFNTYWLMLLALDSSTRVKVTQTFEQASAVGLTVCRTWAFNDGGWRALQISPSVYDEQVFKALDFVVSEANKYKIRLILCLANNWEAYGGKAQYVKWGNAAGLNLTSDDDFFSDPTVIGYYKDYVKAILTRTNTLTNTTYKDDPTIFAWELMNEPRCPSDPSGNMLQSWIQEMSFYVKSIDPNHLLEVGLEGFYGPATPERLRYNPNTFAGQVGTDFLKNHQVFGVDFATVHIYPDAWLSNTISEAYLQFTDSWIQSHIEDAEGVLGKPVLFAEFGVSSEDRNYSSGFRDQFIGLVYKNILNSTRTGGGGGGSLIWQLFPDGTDYMDDGYAVVLTKSPSTSSIVYLQSKRIQTFNSMCTWRCHWGCRRRSL